VGGRIGSRRGRDKAHPVFPRSNPKLQHHPPHDTPLETLDLEVLVAEMIEPLHAGELRVDEALTVQFAGERAKTRRPEGTMMARSRMSRRLAWVAARACLFPHVTRKIQVSWLGVWARDVDLRGRDPLFLTKIPQKRQQQDPRGQNHAQ